MIDWDNPKNLPETAAIPAGGSVEGTITELGFETNMRGQPTLTYTLDHGRKRWCNSQLWRTLGHARVQVGDRVRITRGPDEPSTGQYPRTTWTVERLDQPQPPVPPVSGVPRVPRLPVPVVPAAPVQQVPAW